MNHRPPPASARTTRIAATIGRAEPPEPDPPLVVELAARAPGVSDGVELAEAAVALPTLDAVETGDAVALGDSEAGGSTKLLDAVGAGVGVDFAAGAGVATGVGVGVGAGVGVGVGVAATAGTTYVLKAKSPAGL